MGQLVLPIQPSVDVENQQDLFSSMKPTPSQAMGPFVDSMRENITGGLLKLKELNSAGFTPFGGKRDYVDPETLNAKYGLEGLDFSKHGPRTDEQAKYMYNRKLAEIERKDRRERATGWATAAGVGQDLVAGMLDPVGMGVGFAIAPARFVPGLRALVPVAENAAGKFLPRAASAFATTGFNATVGMAALEPVNYYAHQQEGADYTMADSLMTIAMGGVAGGTLHAGGLGVWKIGQQVNKGLHVVAGKAPGGWFSKIGPETHERAFDTRLKQILAGDDTGIEPLIRADANLQAEARVAKSLDEQLKSTEPQSAPDVQTLAEELKMIAKEMDIEEIELTSIPGRSTERLDMLKAQFDQRFEQLMSAKEIHIKVTGDSLHLNDKSVKYNLDGVVLNNRAFKREAAVPDHLMDFDLAVGYFKHDKSNPFQSFSMETETLNPAGNLVKAAYGTVIVEPDGRIWVVNSKVDSGGYPTSFSKGGLKPAEDAYAAAIRQTFEETGLVVKGLDYLGGFDGSNAFTHYMVAERVGGSPQAFSAATEGMELLTVKELYKRLVTEGNGNDLTVLEKAIGWINKNQKTGDGVFLPHVGKLDPESAALLLNKTKNPYLPVQEGVIPVITTEELHTPQSGPLGSNEGGIYTLRDGSKVYAKFHNDQEQVKAELAASLLYRQAGQFGEVGTPNLHVITENGKPVGIASDWVEGLKPIGPDELAARLEDPNISPEEEARIRQLGGSWVFDAWINNHDVYGTGPTWNIFVDGSRNYVKLDFGGALDFRAQGGKKAFDTHMPELNTFKDYAGKKLIAATTDAQPVGVEMVLRMSKEDIHGALSAAGYAGDELDRVLHRLLARQDTVRKAFPDVAFHLDGLFGHPEIMPTLEMADVWLEQAADTLKAKLSPSMISAIDSYKGSWASDINWSLWNNKVPSNKDLAQLGHMDQAMALSPGLPAETVLWRWQNSHDMNLTPSTVNTLAKSVYHYKGFISTSLHTDTSMANSMKDVLWRFEAEAGIKGVPTKVLKSQTGHEPFPDEFEFIVDRGQLAVIDSVEKVSSLINGTLFEHWQINARLVNPRNLSIDADSMVKGLHAAWAEKQPAADTLFGGEADAHINKLVEDLYQARKPPEVPVLTDEAELKTPAMQALEREIADLDASIKDLDLDDLALKELEMADNMIKDTESFVGGLKQAWACMKGL